MRGLWCALFLAVGAAPLLATSSEEVEVKCPVCGNGFKAEKWQSTNSFGGQDRDFLEQAAGGQVFLFMCWTCPKCHYTGYPRAFDAEKAPAELVARLKQDNPLRPAVPIDPATPHTGEIPAWVRYDLLVQVTQLQEPDAERLAFLYLRAGQTQRFDWKTLRPLAERGKALTDRVQPDERPENLYDQDMEVGRRLEKLAADEASGLSAEDRLLARALAAVQYKSRGEDPDADRVVAALADAKLEPAVKALVDDVRTRIDREREYRGRALPWLEKAHAAAEGEDATNLQYLRGVLYRFQGQNERAVAMLAPLLETEGLPDGFRAWIADELAKAKAGG